MQEPTIFIGPIVTVSSCVDCPYYRTMVLGTVPIQTAITACGREGRKLPAKIREPPDWCPLRSTAILVTLGKR